MPSYNASSISKIETKCICEILDIIRSHKDGEEIIELKEEIFKLVEFNKQNCLLIKRIYELELLDLYNIPIIKNRIKSRRQNINYYNREIEKAKKIKYLAEKLIAKICRAIILEVYSALDLYINKLYKLKDRLKKKLNKYYIIEDEIFDDDEERTKYFNSEIMETEAYTDYTRNSEEAFEAFVDNNIGIQFEYQSIRYKENEFGWILEEKECEEFCKKNNM